MRDITEKILNRMQKVGWYFGNNRMPKFTRPTAWHINCGWCEEWAFLAQEYYGGEVFGLPEPYAHVVLFLENKFYDSQHPDGVSNWEDMDLVKGVTLQEFLEKNQ